MHAPSSSHFIHGQVHISADIHHLLPPTPCWIRAFFIVPGFSHYERVKKGGGSLKMLLGSLLGHLLFTSQCYTHDVCSSARIYILPSKIVYMT